MWKGKTMADRNIFSAPIMRTVPSGVIVQRPERAAQPAHIGPHGGFSIGADHMANVGAVVHVAIHHPDGETMLMTLGAPAFNAFAKLFNAAGDAIQRGAHSQPERPQ